VVDRDCRGIVGIHIEQACLSLFVISSIRSLAERFEEAESIADRRRAPGCRRRRYPAPGVRSCLTLV
jgi:hypothetical protein